MHITPDAFKNALLDRDYATMHAAIARGFDVNTPWRVGRPSFVQIAQTTKDMVSLRMLWEAGAVPDTPWLEQLFEEFAHGRVDDQESLPLHPCMHAGTLDLTGNFTVSRLEFIEAIFDFSGGTAALELVVKPFFLDTECVQTSLRADRISLPTALDDLPGRVFTFPRNPEEGYIDASMCLRDAHNPVYIRSMHFHTLADDKRQIDAVIQMVFDFEDEMIEFPNEELTLSIALVLRHLG